MICENQRAIVTLKHTLPYRLDTEALALGYYVVLDFDYKVVCECKTIEEAEALIAEANETDIKTVQKNHKVQDQMLQEYRKNIQSRSQPSTSNHKSGWSWKDVPDEIKQRFSPPPERSNFLSSEEYEDARCYWQGRVGRNIGLVMQQYKEPIK